jgi:serine/threonine protein phosphatase PrpC
MANKEVRSGNVIVSDVCESLAAHALKKGSQDNISIILIVFNPQR